MDSSPSPSQSTWSSESVAKVKERYCVQVESMTSKGERYPYGGLQVKAELSHDGAVVPGEVEDHGDGTYTITLTSGPHQLLITLDGKHVQISSFDLDVRTMYSTYVSQSKLSSAVVVHVVLPSMTVETSIFQWPQGLAIDPQGNIHVANDNTIEVFTSEGTFVISYGDVKNPFGIVIDEEGYSIVTEYSSNCVSILHSQRSKVHTVGNLNCPYGVMLDPKSVYCGSVAPLISNPEIARFKHLLVKAIANPISLNTESDEDADTPETSTVCFGNNSCSATKITWCQRTSKCVQIAGGGVQGNKASTEFFYQEAVILVGVPKWCKQRQALVSGDGCREVCESDSKEEGTEEGKEKKVKEEEDGEGDEDGQEIFKQDWNKFLDLQ
eukprot:Em0024g504a